MDRKIQAALFAISKDKFTIGECERLAKDLDAHDSMAFDLVGPTGRIGAKWLDAYFGFLMTDGSDGFMRTADFEYVGDVHCENLRWGEDAQGIETRRAETACPAPSQSDESPVP